MTYTWTLTSLRGSSSLPPFFPSLPSPSLPPFHSLIASAVCGTHRAGCWGGHEELVTQIEDNTGHEFQGMRTTFNFLPRGILRSFYQVRLGPWKEKGLGLGSTISHLASSPTLGWRGKKEGLASDDQEKLEWSKPLNWALKVV